MAHNRIFFTELTVLDQPLVTFFPTGDAQLPIEPQLLDQLDVIDPKILPSIPMCGPTSSKIGGFGRTTQAACMLDQVLRGINTPDIDSRLLLLDSLDINIQGFLAQVMPQCQGHSGAFCAAMNIAIRFVTSSIYFSIPHRIILPESSYQLDLTYVSKGHRSHCTSIS